MYVYIAAVVALLIVVFVGVVLFKRAKKAKTNEVDMSDIKQESQVYSEDFVMENKEESRQRSDETGEEERKLHEQVRAVINDACKGGFSELEIRNMFREKGWRDSDIDKLIEEARIK